MKRNSYNKLRKHVQCTMGSRCALAMCALHPGRTHCALRHALLSICSSIAHNGTHRHAPQHAPLVALLNCAYLGDTLLLGMRTLLGMRCTRPKGARTLLHPPRCSGACYSTHAPNYASGCACLGGALLQRMRARS